MNNPSILIGSPIGSLFGVPVDFYTSIVHSIGFYCSTGWDVKHRIATSANVAKNRNIWASIAVSGKYDYLFMVDSDMSFKPVVIQELVKTSQEYNCVSVGLTYLGNPPHDPALFEWNEDLEETKPYTPSYVHSKELPFEVDMAGCFGMMIPVSILKQLGGAPFNRTRRLEEDISFCLRIREAGHKMMCNPQARFDHLRPSPVKPIL